MILPEDQAKAVANADITRLLLPVRPVVKVRRPALAVLRKKGEPKLERTGASATYHRQPWTPTIGHTEPIQSRILKDGRVQIATLANAEIVSTATVELGSLLTDPVAVRQAGHKTAVLFADEWMIRHNKTWPPVEEELCKRCRGYGELDDRGYPAPDGLDGHACPVCEHGVTFQRVEVPDDEIVALFHRRHGHKPVHSIEVRVDDILAARFLSPASRPRGDELGYTERETAGLDAGRAVPAAYQKAIADDARKRDSDEAHERAQAGPRDRAERRLQRSIERAKREEKEREERARRREAA